jgi:nucleotide-binding universal stress UspA family protein
MGFERILCAVDFSDGSLAALKSAIELAHGGSRRLFIFHVSEAQPVFSQWLTGDRLGDVTVELQQAAKESMDELLDSAQLEDVSVETEITNGRAFVEIIKKAREWKADLVVLGAKGMASLDQIVMGSTAERVMKESACSVLIVKNSRET